MMRLSEEGDNCLIFGNIFPPTMDENRVGPERFQWPMAKLRTGIS